MDFKPLPGEKTVQVGGEQLYARQFERGSLLCFAAGGKSLSPGPEYLPGY